jgi:hypothetical protein
MAEFCAGSNAWGSGRWAEAMHRSFLSDLEAGKLERHQTYFRRFLIFPHERFSINAICWNGGDMAQLAVEGDDEHFLSCVAPAVLRRVNLICGESVLSHYAFCTQREHLDSTDVLALYRLVAGLH